MATVHSADSESTEPNGSVFANDCIVTLFPRHDVVKLDEWTFLQWQQQVRFILAGYGLLGFLDGSLTAPTKLVQSSDDMLSVNPSSSVFEQQDNLLTSCFSLPLAHLFCHLSRMFVRLVMCGSWPPVCLLLIQVRSSRNFDTNFIPSRKISEAEQMGILLAGLSSEYDAVVSFVSLSLESLPFQCVVDALLECEACQERTVQDVLIAANLVEGSQSPVVDGSSRSGQSSFRGRGRGF
ncbi:hypothetical protein PVK06_035355 [Gossypium arboreum]|uniref:Uncharacterized protein n=1 Tax=Gossypium arboreum TaxID=29729 RepID=A0ABR0NJN2_GOSAR|nr:hypothetical protein PVK06_035355 [Gossypium arboreum]